MAKCKADYKNLNHIQSFSEQSYATVQWARQVCQNDEWLRQQVEQLRYLTPPAIRKRYNIAEFFDKSQSYGARVNGTEVGFNNYNPDDIFIDFTDMDLIDTAKSNVDFITEPDNDGAPTTYARLQTHPEETPANYESFGTSTGGTNNSFWYVGYNKSKNYNLKAEWLKNWKRNDIPSVCRAQTFKVPTGKGGVLESISLKLEYNGSKNQECASPLYVQIWNTYKKFVVKTIWDNTKKKMVYHYINYDNLPASDSNNKGQYKENYSSYQKYVQYQKKLKYTSGKKKGQYKEKDGNIITETAYRKYDETKDSGKTIYVREREYIQWVGHNKKINGKWAPNIDHPLAETSYSKVGDPWPTIKFEKPCIIEEGKTYAIVVFSPLSDWKHCPRWGGWGRNCKRDNKYPDGNAFMSEDNGRTWKRYGKNGADTNVNGKVLEYKKGKYTPQDFAFECNVETEAAKIDTVYNNDEEYLYLKPILTNPIKEVKLSYEGEGHENTLGQLVHIEYEVSIDGDEWLHIDNATPVNFASSIEDNEGLPRMLLVRARLWRDDVEEAKTLTPFIKNMRVMLTTGLPVEMYARTSFHIPKTEPMLGANIWGRIYAPFVNDSTVDCSMEIIQGETVTDHFNFVKLSDVDEKLMELELDYPEVESIDGENRAIYLTEHPEIIIELKQRYTYIIPYESDNKLYLLSFAPSYASEDRVITKTEDDDSFGYFPVGGLSFSNEVAYPIISVRSQSPTPDSSDGVDVFSEWIDYTFDYESNELIFKPSTLDDLVEGDLEITYNPIFISGLSPDEVGIHIDEETGLASDGLILDYFKEKIIISDENIETRRVSLRAKPTDPIRQVYLYDSSFGENNEPRELFEDKDFTLDIETNELVFKSEDNSNVIFTNGDILQVVYTPSLEDSKLALGYFAKRTDTNMQVHIKDVYFEVKA